MSKLAVVYINNSPTFQLSFDNTTTIKEIKKFILQYFKQYDLEPTYYTSRFFIDRNTEVNVFNDENYDDKTLKSLWNSITEPQIFVTLYRKKFTGNKDVDMLILKNLDDETITSLCKTNKYISGVCQKLYKNERYWEDKLINIAHESLIKKPKKLTWHQYYVKFFTYDNKDIFKLIKKVLPTVHPETQITKEGVEYIVNLIKPIWNKIKKVPQSELYDVLKVLFNDNQLYQHAIYALEHLKTIFNPHDRRNIIEYLIAEILELSGNATRDKRKTRINVNFIKKSIQEDDELRLLFSKN